MVYAPHLNSSATQHVEQQVRGHVDVRALLLPVGVGHHEHGAVHHPALAVLHHHRPGWPDEFGPAGLVLDRQRGRLDPGHVAAVLDVVHAPRRGQRLEVHVLVGLAGWVAQPVDPGGAVDQPGHPGVRPVRAAGDQRGGQRAQVQPAPARGTPPAQPPAAVVQVEAVHVDPDTHRGNVTPPAGRRGCAILEVAALVVAGRLVSVTGPERRTPPDKEGDQRYGPDWRRLA